MRSPGNRLARIARALDRPALTTAVVAAAYAMFLAARLGNLAGDPSRFVFAGDRFCNPADVPPNLAVGRDSPGYDGQFFYRLAVAPFSRERTAFGVTLDEPAYRQQRILYPLLAWLVSFGDPARVPAALILVNYLALCGLAWLGSRLSRELGQHALYGLMLAFYPGFLLSLSRDTAEIVEACSLLAALFAIQTKRRAPAAAALVLAVLTRETAFMLVASVAIVFLAQRRGRNAAARHWPVFAIPIAVGAAWQTYLWACWGRPGVLSGGGNLGLPFAGFGQFLEVVLHGGGGYHDLWLGEMFFLGVVSTVALLRLRSSVAAAPVKLGWLMYAALAMLLSGSVWIEDWAFLRALSEYYLLAAVVVLGVRSRSTPLLVAYTTALWFVVMRTRLH